LSQAGGAKGVNPEPQVLPVRLRAPPGARCRALRVEAVDLDDEPRNVVNLQDFRNPRISENESY
jgi:hypothetical protein